MTYLIVPMSAKIIPTTPDTRPLVLLCNDDGYDAPGLRHVINTLRPIARLMVVAPSGPRSGKACSITTEVPFTNRLVEHESGVTIMACTGTPVDCVKLALDHLMLDEPPVLVVSGINHGSNASINAHYSGTVGACIEAAIKGVPAIAFSHLSHSWRTDFAPTSRYILHLVQHVLAHPLPKGSLLNVNFPEGDTYVGLRVCRMANSQWRNEVEPASRPGSHSQYYWLGGAQVDLEPNSTDTDLHALREGYVSVVPLTLDMTHYDLLTTLPTML